MSVHVHCVVEKINLGVDKYEYINNNADTNIFILNKCYDSQCSDNNNNFAMIRHDKYSAVRTFYRSHNH